MFFLFRNKKNKNIFARKWRRDTNGREHGYTHMCLFIPAACDLGPVSQKFVRIVFALRIRWACVNL